MALNLTMANQREELKPRITVFGVGGAGGNAVNNMIEKQLDGVEFVVANTDAQALQQSHAHARVQMGVKVTEGLGAGARPSVGAAAAEETIEEIVDHLAGSHMCFITAGMGGGTGTGAAPIIAQAARELGVLTVGVVTKPFQFEGAKRMRQAEDGIEALQKVVDTLIIIPNQNLFRLANDRTTFTEAFAMADDVLYQGVKGVTDLMVRPGLINLDFADVRAVMDEMGKAMMGTGEAEGDDRAVQAAEKAIANPLLDEISLNGAHGVLINITGGSDLTLFELDEAANIIREKVDPEANIIVGSTLDPAMEGRIRVSVVATGIDASQQHAAQTPPIARRSMAEPLVAAVRPAAAAAVPAGTDNRADMAPDLFAAPASPAAHSPEFEPESIDADEMSEEEAGAGDLPPPAYRPREQAAAAPVSPAHQPIAAPPLESDAGAFVAPRPRVPGQPSRETIARLHAAVARRPAAEPMRAEPVRAEPAPAPAATKPRFGISSLINRMASLSESSGPETGAHLRQPPVHAEEDDNSHHDSERERIEIPAFLRRQAN